MSESTYEPVVDPVPDVDALDGDPSRPSGLPDGDWQVSDSSGDGLDDTAVQQLLDGGWTTLADVDGDLGVDGLVLDTNGDGRPEIVVTEDGDGYRLQIDGDGDGVLEDARTMTRAELEAIDPTVIRALDAHFGMEGAQVHPANAGTEETWVVEGQLVGDPVGDAEHWFHQAANGFCVPASVAQIVSEYTGVHYADEQAFVEKANELRLFTVGPDGVPGIGLDGALQLLKESGVPAGIDPNGTVEKLQAYLDDGRAIILAVDSGEVWGSEAVEDDVPDHAVVISGINVEDGVAVLSDPGRPDGNMFEVPLDQLVDAWDDSGNAMIVTDTAPDEATASVVPGWEESPVTDGTFPRSVSVDMASAPVPIPAGGDASVLDELGGLPGRDDDVADSVVSFVGRHPYVLLPVVLGAGVVVRAISSR